jgi:tetratricopeptide (TPR) repeat protein
MGVSSKGLMVSNNKQAAIRKPPGQEPSAKPSQQELQDLVGLYNSGQLTQAEAKARKMIKAFPGILVLYDILSAAQAGQGKLEKAARSCQRALEVNPEHIGAHSNLGIIFRQLGRLDEAISSCRKALIIDPRHAQTQINLGVALRTMGRLDEAVHCYREALKVKPDSFMAHSNLGNALKDIGQFDEAVASHREAVNLNPNSPEVHNNLGNALHQLGEFTEAIVSFEQGLKLRPGNADTLSNLGKALKDAGKSEEAIASYERALEINPNHFTALYNLGAIYERMNNVEKAADYTQKALEIVPDDPGIILLWSVLLRRMKKTDEAASILEPLANMALSDAMRIQVHGELGKLCDLKKDSARAFRHFSTANDLQAKSKLSSVVDKQTFLDQILQMDTTLTPEWISSWQALPEDEDYETPAFLVGFPRSGTTLIDQIMDSHPGVQVMEEQPPLYDVATQVAQKYGDYPDIIGSLKGEDIAELRDLYFRSVGSYFDREPGTLLVDKMPLHIRQIPLIYRMFPKARIILALRHPCDVVLSNFMQHYKINEAMSNFLTLEDAAHCYAQVMSLWQKSANLLSFERHIYKYESLIDDFEVVVRGLLNFLELEWDDAVLEFDKHARQRRGINTPSYQAVSEPINARARYRWKRYKDPLASVMNDLEPFIEAFGYSET